jgi:hypothetical protein
MRRCELQFWQRWVLGQQFLLPVLLSILSSISSSVLFCDVLPVLMLTLLMPTPSFCRLDALTRPSLAVASLRPLA